MHITYGFGWLPAICLAQTFLLTKFAMLTNMDPFMAQYMYMVPEAYQGICVFRNHNMGTTRWCIESLINHTMIEAAPLKEITGI